MVLKTRTVCGEIGRALQKSQVADRYFGDTLLFLVFTWFLNCYN